MEDHAMRHLVIGLTLLALTATMTSPAAAQAPGSADPLGLASVGIVIPFFSSPENISKLELASPVGENTNVTLFFFKADCSRSNSFRVPLTENDIAVVDPLADAAITFDGLILIAGLEPGSFDPVPFSHPIHARVRWTNAQGFVRTLDPTTVRNAEGAPSQTWNPLRTAATFVVPRQGTTRPSGPRLVFQRDNESTLYLICPTAVITGEIIDGPPLIPPRADQIHGFVYDADEEVLADWVLPCSCLTTVRVKDIAPIFSSLQSLTYYTELWGTARDESLGSFTGYLATQSGPAAVGAKVSDDFARLRNGSFQNIRAQSDGIN